MGGFTGACSSRRRQHVFQSSRSRHKRRGFGSLFELEAGRRCFITTPVVVIKHLTRRGRVVITATEPANEVNETLYHLDLAETLGDPQLMAESDWDRDGTVRSSACTSPWLGTGVCDTRSRKNSKRTCAALDGATETVEIGIKLNFFPRHAEGRHRYSWPPRMP